MYKIGRSLFGETYCSGFTDDSDFDLTGVGHFVLDATSDFGREFFGLSVVDLVGPDDYAELATGLNCVGLDNAGIGEGELLEIVEALDVGFDNFAAGTGASTGDGVAYLNDRSQQGSLLDFVVVGADSVADFGFFLVFLGELHAEESVGQLGLFVGHFTYGVEQTRTAGFFGIKAKFRGHNGAEIGSFAGVLQEVLTVG